MLIWTENISSFACKDQNKGKEVSNNSLEQEIAADKIPSMLWENA